MLQQAGDMRKKHQSTGGDGDSSGSSAIVQEAVTVTVMINKYFLSLSKQQH